MKHKSVASATGVSVLRKEIFARVVQIQRLARLNYANGSACSIFCVVVFHSGLPVIFFLSLCLTVK